MNGTVADILGICGSVIFLVAFTYANRAKVLDKLLFNAANLIGAVLLLISLSVHFNLAAFVLEAAWGVIAFISLIAEWRARRRAAG